MRARAAAASGCGFVLVLLLVVTGWSPLRRLDRGIADDLNRAFSPPGAAARFFEIVSLVGRPGTFSALAVLAALAILWRRRDPCRAVAVALTVVLAPALTNLVKVIVGRERPTVPDPFAHAPGASFPSGHALAAAVGVVVAVGLVPSGRTGLRLVAAGLAASVAALIGVSRLVLGVHYLSDVAAGWLLGLAWALTMPAAFERLAARVRARARTRRASASPDRPRARPPA